jgi:pimeloyl-ACP methyl ester carboxylesterase
MFVRLYEGLQEEALTCGTPDGVVHAVIYRPSKPAGMAVVIVPPDGEERMFGCRPLVTTARALASAGCTVMRFDYVGQGQSDGDYEATTLSTRIGNLKHMWQQLKDDTGRAAALLGVRLGGTVALAAALEIPDVRDMILWEPVMDPSVYLHQLLRVNVSTQMVAHGRVLKDRNELIADAHAGRFVSVNGFNLSGGFMDDLLTFDVHAAARQWPGRALVLTSGPVDARLAALPSWSASRVPSAPFWKEPKIHSVVPPTFFEPTLDWLVASSPAAAESR